MTPSFRKTFACLSALLAFIAFQSCGSVNCVTGTGDVTKRTLPIAELRGITAQGSLDVRLKQGPVRSVEVEAQANLIDLLSTEVRDGIWHIGTEQCYNTTKPFIVHITVPKIEHVALQGSGDVTGLDRFTTEAFVATVQGSGELTFDIEARSVDATVQGSGDITLTGKCTAFAAHVQGSGDIDGMGLISEKASTVVVGSGNIGVHAAQELNATIQGSGDIRYKGQPANLVKNVQGSGDVEPVP